MKATTNHQRHAACAAAAAKRGETPKETLKGLARRMFDSMSEEELSELASNSNLDGAPKQEQCQDDD